jgi:hypothetical protein
MTTPAPEKVVRKSNRIATVIFRFIVGLFALVILGIAIRFKLNAESWKAIATIGAFCGLLLGYAFGGDKWGARLFTLFTGHHVPINEGQRKLDSPSPPKLDVT